MTLSTSGRRLIGSTKAALLSRIRRGRLVAWTPPWMRFGNYLMLGLWAHESAHQDRRRFALLHSGNQLLETVFPGFVREYLLRPDQVRFTDQRLMPWSGGNVETFKPDVLANFIDNVLLPETPLRGMDRISPETVVVNVRRGDYYSVPEHKKEYGINIRGYVRTALESMSSTESVSHLQVVSDDVPWCQRNLDAMLLEFASVTYQLDSSPQQDLASIVHARRLIIPNSTFSMWGGYLGDRLHRDRVVYAPSIFARSRNGGRGDAYLDSWHLVEDVPGGWDPQD